MTDDEFKQKLAITLAGNPEFVLQAKKDHEGRYESHRIGFCVSTEINIAISGIEIKAKNN